jgi:hypothetical protein
VVTERRRIPSLTARAAAVAATAVLATCAAPAPASAPARAESAVPVYAYYYIWFNPSSWRRAKIDKPLLGGYSSDDTSVMRRHVAWAKSAGIDGFLVSWKHTNLLDRRLEKLIAVADEEHFKLGIVYEGLDFHRNPLPVDRVAADLKIFQQRYASDRAFTSGGRKPRVIWTGTWRFSSADVAWVTRQLRPHIEVLASEKNVKGYERVAPSVDGDAYYWSSVNPQTFPGYPQKLAAMGSAVHAHGGTWIAPVAPGFDARRLGGSRSVDRRGGATLRTEWNAAIASAPDNVGLISWNEFSENSQVEPSRNFGYSALHALADIRGTKLDVGAAIDSSTPSARGSGTGVQLIGLLAAMFVGALVLVRRRDRERASRGRATARR